MVRARRVGAKEKLSNAEAEIARLKAELADPHRVADGLVADSPVGIQILGTEAPKITGGMTRRQVNEKVHGKQWWVKVTELALPHAKDVHRVASFCNKGEYIQEFRANTEILLPENEIKKLEEECIVIDQRMVQIGDGGMELATAKALNTGMDIKTDAHGQTWLVRSQPRFHVQRIRPEQESVRIS